MQVGNRTNGALCNDAMDGRYCCERSFFRFNLHLPDSELDYDSYREDYNLHPFDFTTAGVFDGLEGAMPTTQTSNLQCRVEFNRDLPKLSGLALAMWIEITGQCLVDQKFETTEVRDPDHWDHVFKDE